MVGEFFFFKERVRERERGGRVGGKEMEEEEEQ